MIGTAISYYTILEKLGEGGMGVVYKARDNRLDRAVALKFLPERVHQDATEKARFLQEAKAAAALNHPNICTIHSVEETGGSIFMVMEYVDGGTIRSKIPFDDAAESVRIAIQVGEALQEAHLNGIVHRDVKADNVMVTSKGHAKVMDFGLAKLKGSLKLTRTSFTVGTMGYMAPEQIRGGTVDHRSDIFSFGVLLFEMLTGSFPFRGEHEAAMLYSILNEEPMHFPAGSPPDRLRYESAVRRMLEKEPSARFQSMAEAVANLRAQKPGRMHATAGGTAQPASIAVLPFADLSPSRDQEYFCDGIAEEIINALTKLDGLQVVARTSAFAFRGKSQDMREIGSRLSVSTVLEGSLRKAGKRLRITAQLINVADGYHLWSERFDREEEDVFAVQDEISQAVVRALKGQLTGGPAQDGLVKVHTANLDAYNLYLQGRYEWGKRTADGLRRSIEFYRKAIRTEPRYALAYAALADSYCLLCSYHILSPFESIPQAKEASLRAIGLDPVLAEGHEALGHVMMLYDWDWNRAVVEYAESIALSPLFPTAHQRNALLKTVHGKTEDATDEILKAEKLDPLSLIIITDTALVQYIRGNYGEAADICTRVLGMNADFAVARFVLGLSLEQSDDREGAVRELGRAVALSGNNSIYTASLAHCLARGGSREAAETLLADLERRQDADYVSPYSLALVHLGLGNREAALNLLGAAIEDKSVWHIHLHMSIDPRLKELHGTPEFSVLEKRMNLPVTTP